MNRILFIAVAASLSIAPAIAFADEEKDESGQGRGSEQRYYNRGKLPKEKDRKDWEGRRESRDNYFYRHGYTRLDIPPGHYPPPGECRIWFPDRPAGQQPPPQRCDRIPPGAWAIRHPRSLPGHVHVDVYDPQRPGVLVAVGEFEISSGAFIRIVVTQ